ncbi:hypothetical protein BZZ01_17495 [Nostocales cyanobacterium HT-58-2]|nr:hypothetical protein BZZ01_17495 [Nostocales cyanobacterium HT-58-2]
MKRLRQILTVFLIGLTFFVMQAFGGTLQARADNTVKSPEGIYYKAVPGDTGNIRNNNDIRNDNKLVENARRNLKDTADNVREKLNVGESLSQKTDDTVRSPEGIYYKGTPDEAKARRDDNNPLRDAGKNLKGAADNVREKLNLDEELPRSTKDFLKSNQRRTEDRVRRGIDDKEGYFQEPPEVRPGGPKGRPENR